MPETAKLNLRLPPALREQAAALAADQGISLNAFLVLGVRNWVEFQTRRASTAPRTPRATGPSASARSSAAPAVPKVGPNMPCPCGSGQKYKRCHGRPGQV